MKGLAVFLGIMGLLFIAAQSTNLWVVSIIVGASAAGVLVVAKRIRDGSHSGDTE